MKRLLLLAFTFSICNIACAQKEKAYTDSIKAFQKNYITTHEVVKKNDRKYFRFFPISETYNISCSFEKINDSIGFTMRTSANTLQFYYTYGRLSFNLSGTECHLYVYRSKDLMKTEKYKDYLFVPFTDATTGDESYGSGRYLEFYIPEIKNNKLQLDFNKAYNPYCAYSAGYHCPIPPKENNLPIAVKAGEMNFGKHH